MYIYICIYIYAKMTLNTPCDHYNLQSVTTGYCAFIPDWSGSFQPQLQVLSSHCIFQTTFQSCRSEVIVFHPLRCLEESLPLILKTPQTRTLVSVSTPILDGIRAIFTTSPFPMLVVPPFHSTSIDTASPHAMWHTRIAWCGSTDHERDGAGSRGKWWRPSSPWPRPAISTDLQMDIYMYMYTYDNIIRSQNPYVV